LGDRRGCDRLGVEAGEQLADLSSQFGPQHLLDRGPRDPGWLQEWSRQIGAELKDDLRENPGWIALALEDGTVYHTYTATAPDPFVAPYFSSLIDRTPKAQPAEPRSWRKDEYRD